MRQVLTWNAKGWSTHKDFYDALLTAVGAPTWHSRSPDALIDSMIWGGFNSVDPPYVVRIINAGTLDRDTRQAVNEAKESIDIGRNDRRVEDGDDIDASIEVVD